MEKHPRNIPDQRNGRSLGEPSRFLPFFSSPSRRTFKLGRTATKAYNQVISFLTKDIDIPKSISSAQLTTIYRKPSEKDNERKQLRRLVKRSNDLLAIATAVFPFQLFPDTIMLDRTKLTIIKRTFFFTQESMSIRIEDILNVSTSVGPFFGSITIASRVMSSEDHFTTNFFWRDDAIRLKHIIQGYVIAQHNNIKTSHLSREELIKTLAQLGNSKN